MIPRNWLRLLAVWLWAILSVFVSSAGFTYDCQPSTDRAYDVAIESVYDGTAVLALDENRNLPDSVPDLFPKFPRFLAAKPRAASGDFYSVAYEMKLDASVLGRNDCVHFNRANAALDAAIRSDAEFAARTERLIPGVSDSVSRIRARATPEGAGSGITQRTWRNATGATPKTPTQQHFLGYAAPRSQGGYSIWGKYYDTN